ncbi:MAG TPA: DNA-3-methyladenine glycosylase [Acidimicrobiia bacterium]|nr:DNA-3-methyladenine glycosylase [Acidimicrobiia bacterium]
MSRRGRALPRSFFARDSLELAPLLLNKVLVRDDPDGGGRLAARLVEVEAYHGAADPGSHGYRGMTPRTTTMFGAAGHLYVYFTYGMHWCANVVASHAPGDAGAVLLRAAAPLDGLDVMRSRRRSGGAAKRSVARTDLELCAGPARLCQAFGITGDRDGTDLTRGTLRLVDDGVAPPAHPFVGTRIGLAPGKGDESPWRFCVPGDPHISRPPRGRSATEAAADNAVQPRRRGR